MTEKENNQINLLGEHKSLDDVLPSGMNETIRKNLSDMVVYNPEFDEREDVKKIYIIRGVCLYFVPIQWSNKYVFCSADAKLQEWCESVKNKNVKWKNIRFIVDAAKKYMKGETQLPEKSTSSIYANRSDNPVWTLQNILQKQWKMPEYSAPTEWSLWGIVVTLSVDGYNDITQWAQNQKEARKACAIKFAKECLWIDVEAEQDLVKWKQPKTQHMEYQTEKLPDSFKVPPDECGNRDEDAVSALQVFCQKNKLWMPRYIDWWTSQWYVTQSTIRMKIWGFSTIQSAWTKKEAKQKCARVFYKEILNSDWWDVATIEDRWEQKELNPWLFKWWEIHPRYTLEDYCGYYGIELTIEDEIDRTVMKIWDEKFYTRNEDYDGNYKSASAIKDELAKFYYDTRLVPMLKKQQKEKINNASEDILDNFPIMDMSSYEEKGNMVWTWILNQLCARSHIPAPWYEMCILRDWTETKCGFPTKANMKSRKEWEIRVVYMKIAWMKQKIRGEWRSFKDAQHDAARRFLRMMRERQ